MATTATENNTDARKALIAKASEAWRTNLIDPSRRNNLLYYRPLQAGTLEIPGSENLVRFLTHRKTITIERLLKVGPENIANLRAISRKGLENFEERGLSTLYLAIGKCSWTADDKGRDPFAPVVLFPVRMTLKGVDAGSTELEITGRRPSTPCLSTFSPKR